MPGVGPEVTMHQLGWKRRSEHEAGKIQGQLEPIKMKWNLHLNITTFNRHHVGDWQENLVPSP